MDCSLSRSSVHGILQARILEWVAISFSRGPSQPRDRTRVSCIAGRCFTIWATREDLRPHELQHTRPPCPSPTPGVHSDSHPSGPWCHPAISSSVVLFSSFPKSLPASESFPVTHLFSWDGQSTGVSALASFLPKNTQDQSPLEWTGWISLQSKGTLTWYKLSYLESVIFLRLYNF